MVLTASIIMLLWCPLAWGRAVPLLTCGSIFRRKPADTNFQSLHENSVSTGYIDDEDFPPWISTQTISWKISRFPQLGEGVTRQDIERATKEGLAMWSAVCNLNFRYDPRSASTDLDIKFFSNSNHDDCSSPFGMNVLAHYMPSRNLPAKLHFNDQQEFTIDPDDTEYVSLVAVMAHEVGHALGFAHIEGDSGSIMYYQHIPHVKVLSQADKNLCANKYGRR